MAEYAREEINAIGGFYAYGKDMINGSSVYDFDVTKLSVYTRDIGLAGIIYDGRRPVLRFFQRYHRKGLR